MKRTVRRILMVILTLAFVGGGAAVLHQGLDLHQAQKARQQAAELAGVEQAVELTEPPVPLAPEPVAQPEPELDASVRFLKELDLATLMQTNPDVQGWICIPGTQLSYPYLQGKDNQYYLSHTWEGKKNAAGSVFLECKVSADLSDFNTIVYGHNMKNGSIFGSLRQYRKQSHFEEHPSFYIADAAGIRRYDIFAAMEAEVTEATYWLKVNSPERKQRVLDYSAARSVIQTGVIPTVDDRIVTLSTCTGNGYETRWVVQGVLRQVWPY